LRQRLVAQRLLPADLVLVFCQLSLLLEIGQLLQAFERGAGKLLMCHHKKNTRRGVPLAQADTHADASRASGGVSNLNDHPPEPQKNTVCDGGSMEPAVSLFNLAPEVPWFLDEKTWTSSKNLFSY